MEKKKKKILITIDPELLKGIKHWAIERNITVTRLLLQAVIEKMAREKA